MLVYNYRIYDRHRQPVISLAVMGDEDQTWRPSQFGYGMFGCTMAIQFPIVKLLDYSNHGDQLETASNVFAAVVLAHLKTQATRADPVSRRVWKFRLIKGLYSRGLDGEQVRLLFRFLDAIIDLPQELEKALRVDLAEFEKERVMPYVSSIERMAREEGKAEAKVETLLRLLNKRFKTALPEELEGCIRSTTDLAKLDAWIDTTQEVDNLADFRRICGI